MSREGANLFTSFIQQFKKIKNYKELLLEHAFSGSFTKIKEIKDDNDKSNQFKNNDQLQMTQRQLMMKNNAEKCTLPQSLSTSFKVDTFIIFHFKIISLFQDQ